MVLGGCILAIIALFLPPFTVLLRAGCGVELLICIGLIFLGWIPGVIYAWFILLDKPNARQRRRARRGLSRAGSEPLYGERYPPPPMVGGGSHVDGYGRRKYY